MKLSGGDRDVGAAHFARPSGDEGRAGVSGSFQHRLNDTNAAADKFSVSLCSIDPADEIVEQWRALGARALVPNIFYEVEYAQAAALAFGKGVKLLTVHLNEGEAGRMVAAWPVRVSTFRWGMPLRVLAGWGHPFAASGVPLLDAEYAEPALAALLSASKSIRRLPRRVFMPLVPDQGPFRDVLDRVQASYRVRVSRTETHDRVYWARGLGDEALASLSSSTRSKLRQEFRRLERGGPVVLESITDPAALKPALDDYLALELSGWKGRAGTAIPQSPGEMAFVTQLVEELGKRGRVRIDRLRQEGVTLASSIAYLNGDHAWYAKISYNEEHAKNSPGSHLVMMVSELMRTEGVVNFVDSCAPPHHPLMRKFWQDSFWVSNVLMEMAGGDPLFGPAAALERLRPSVREAVHHLRAGFSRRSERAQRKTVGGAERGQEKSATESNEHSDKTSRPIKENLH
jgi:CelD/BcsL family acetyltransferase involved in cellulose biosynthesis